MKTKMELILNYNFDPEEGYTQKSLIIDSNEFALYESLLNNERKLIVHLYEDDIRDLLNGTGVEIDGN